MTSELSSAIEFFIVVFSELAVLFIVISFLVSFINHKLPANKIKQMLSGNRGYGIAVALGSITPFCSCSTLPMTIGLIQARASFGPVMAFLFTSPLLNPFIVGLFWVSFGAKITLIYSVFVILLAISSGYLLQKLKFERFVRADIFDPDCSDKGDSNCNVKDKKSIDATDTAGTASATGTNNGLSWNKLLRTTLKQFISFTPYMAIGITIGAFLHGYVPAAAFEQLAGQEIWWLIPAAALIGVFLYVRASTMVPIAASLAAKGMSMGAIMSLTIAGAGASLPEMIMMKRMFHWPLVLAFVVLVFSTACVTGFAIDII